MAKALEKVFAPALDWMAVRYTSYVGNVLKKYGLRYEDLYDPLLNQDVDEALRRLPAEEVMGRNQRLKRASDVSLKRAYLPEDLQKLQTPFLPYLQDALTQVEAENAEKAALDTSTSYDRQIP
eukprot:jgi/Botrbrau1/15034/Bobra.320_2s0008.1